MRSGQKGRRTIISRRSVIAAAGAAPLIVQTGSRARAAVSAPVAVTAHGPVRGYRDGGVLVFKGVRYGADTGPRRFDLPAPPPGPR